MAQTEYKPIKVTAEQYDTLRDLKVEIFKTENASFREVVDELIEEYEDD
jgi:predicted CopG family antitoxin